MSRIDFLSLQQNKLIMNKDDWKVLIEAVLYILNITKGLDYYRVFKVLYFAQKEHLSKYGMKIVEDDFVKYQYGPVPAALYDSIKRKILKDDIDIVDDYTMIPKRICDIDYLSQSNIQCLDFSIKENAGLTFDELKEKSHDSAWKNTGNKEVITPMQIALAAGADDHLLEYIREQEELDLALL